jgi:hypothetical protein
LSLLFFLFKPLPWLRSNTPGLGEGSKPQTNTHTHAHIQTHKNKRLLKDLEVQIGCGERDKPVCKAGLTDFPSTHNAACGLASLSPARPLQQGGSLATLAKKKGEDINGSISPPTCLPVRGFHLRLDEWPLSLHRPVMTDGQDYTFSSVCNKAERP